MVYVIKEQLLTLEHYYEQKDSARYFKLVDDVLHQLKENDDMAIYIKITMDKAALYFQLHNYTLAIQTLTNVSAIIQAQTVEQKIRYYNLLAAIHGSNQNLTEAFDYLQTARFLAEQSDNKEMLIRIYHNLSMYYFEQQQFEESLFYCEKSNAYLKDTKAVIADEYLLHLTHARVLIHLHRFTEAQQMINFEEQELAHINGKVQLLLTKADYFEQQQKHMQAYTLLKQATTQFTDSAALVTLYDRMCPLSKQCNTPQHYLDDLKAFYDIKNTVLQKEREEQLQAIEHYFDERPYKEISWRDPLTNIYNRRFLEENYTPYEQRHAILLFDIDHFKSINDTYGHLTGDEAIKKMASTTATFFNEQAGLVVRLGGDEFAVIFPVDCFEALYALLEQFLERVRHLKIACERQHFHITTSVGAYLSDTPLPLQRALEKADIALYEAKRNGRNQFIIHKR